MPSPASINQLVLVVASGTQTGELMDQLSYNDFYFTEIDSSGGVFHESTGCLLVGLDRTRLEALLELVRECCKPYRQFIPATIHLQPQLINPPMIEAQVGGALVYILDVERFEQI